MGGHAISRVIKQLAARNGFLHRDGRVNCSAVGRFTDLPSTTIMRLLKAGPYSSPRVHTIRRISDAFNIRESQLLGYEALDDVDSTRIGETTTLPEGSELRKGADVVEQPLSDMEMLFISRLRPLSPRDREEALRFVEFKGRAAEEAAEQEDR